MVRNHTGRTPQESQSLDSESTNKSGQNSLAERDILLELLQNCFQVLPAGRLSLAEIQATSKAAMITAYNCSCCCAESNRSMMRNVLVVISASGLRLQGGSGLRLQGGSTSLVQVQDYIAAELHLPFLP